MTLILRMALRNLWRNKRRSFFVIGAIAAGMASILFLWAFSEGTMDGMRQNAISMITAHFQVKPVGDSMDAPALRSIQDKDQWIEAIQKIEGVESVTHRLKTPALIGTADERSQGIIAVGLDPKTDRSVFKIQDKVKRGHGLGNEPREILIGKRLAKRLGIEPGAKVILMARDAYGMSMGYSFTVAGVFASGSREIDERIVYGTIEAVRELVGFENEISEIAVRLNEPSKVNEVVAALKAKGLNDDVMTWGELAPEVQQWEKYGRNIFFICMIVVAIVAALGAANTLFMSVFERMREFGVMHALGVSGAQIVGIVILEALFLQVIGITIGIGAGYILVADLNYLQIPMSHVETAMESNFLNPVLSVLWLWPRVWESVIWMFIVITMISLFPAVKAAKMKPLAAIYRS